MATTQFLFAGFGGQGILFSGKFLANEGLFEGRNVSWLPSYGPEMRGGTANCSVILSDSPIGSPIVTKPNVLVAMNRPSYEKYENDVTADGMVFIDSTLIDCAATRTDIKTFRVPATRIAADEGYPTLANMVLLGKVIKETGIIPFENVERALRKIIPAKKADLIDVNLKALTIGYNYQE